MLGLVLLAISSAAIAYFTRNLWTAAVASWAAERFAKTSLEIDELTWTGLHRLELHGVRVAAHDPGSALREARFDTLTLDFDCRELARDGLSGLHAVDAGRAELSVDLARESEPDARPTETAVGWPRELPSIHVRDLDLEVRLDGSRSLRLSSAVLGFDPEGEAAAIALSAQRVEYRDPERSFARPLALSATWRAGTIEVSRLDLDPRFQLQRLFVDMRRIAAGELEVDAAGSAFGGEHEIHVALAPESVSARLRSRTIDLASVLAVLAADTATDPPADLSARVDLDLDLTLPLDEPGDPRTTAHGRVRLDALDVRFADHSLDWLRADLSADARGVHASEIFLLQGANQARITDLLLPRGVFEPCELRHRLTCAFEAEIGDLPALLAQVGEPGVGLSPHRASLRGWIADQALELEGGELLTTGGRLTIERGHVPLAPDWRTIAADPELALRMHARFEDLAPLVEILAWPPIEGRLEAAVGILGGDEGLHGWADVQAEDLRVWDQALGSVATHCELARRRLDIEHMQVIGPDANLDVRGRILLDELSLDGVHVRGWLRDASVLRIGALPRGGIEVDADLSGKWPEIDGRVFARASVLETDSLGRVRAEIDVRSTRGRISVDELSLESRYGSVRARGAAGTLAEITGESGALCLRVDALDWKDGAQDLRLVEPVDLEVSAQGVHVSGLALRGSSGSLQATLALGASNGHVHTIMQGFDPMPWIARFTANDVRCGRIDLDLDASWSASEVRAQAKGRAPRLQLGSGAPLTDVEIDCTLKDRRATIERLSVSSVFLATDAEAPGDPLEPINEAPLEFSGEFPLDLVGDELLPDGPIRLAGSIEVHNLGRAARVFGTDPSKVRGRLRADLDLSGTWAAPHGKVVLDASELSWIPKTSDQVFGPCAIRGEFDLDHDLLIQSLELDLPAGLHVDCAGRVSGPYDLRDVLRAEASAWRDAPLELVVRVQAANLSLLTVMIPSLRRLGGRLEGAVQVRGTLAAPRYSGELELADGEVRTTSALASLSGITAKLTLEGDRVRLDALKGEMGGAPFSLGGTISPFGAEPRVDLELLGQHLLLYRARGLRVRADAKLAITGPLSAMDVRGDLTLDDSRFTRDFDFLSAFGKKSSSPPLFSRPLFELPAPFATATFDVKVGSTKPFVLQNNVVKGGLRPELRIVGTGALPILRGTIIIDPTRVSLPSGTITARSGAVEFLPSAPFAPRIDALADARLQGYDIKLHLSGTIQEPVVELSSVPPLPYEDLLLLVLTGTLPRPDQKSPTGVRAAKQVAVYLANDAISSWFSSSDGDSQIDADLLEVQTGGDVSETGTETTTARLRVWKGIFSDNSSLYITGERDIYDFYNFGVRLLFRFP